MTARSGLPRWLAPFAQWLAWFLALCALGAVVAVGMSHIEDREPLRSMNRAIGDYLMRDVARDRLAGSAAGPRAMFVSVGERSCRAWTSQPTGCTLGFSVPRDKLAKLVNDIGADHPSLLVLDFDLSPDVRPGNADETLCNEVRMATQSFPVIATLPLVPGTGPARRAPSLLDNKCAADGAHPLLFASPLLRADADGVVREVQAWTTVGDDWVFGVGFLAAALQSPATLDEITCFVPVPRCARPISLREPPYIPRRGSDEKYERIQFTLPWHAEEDTRPDPFGYSPGRFDMIEAIDLPEGTEAVNRIRGAVVFVGASYAASGDLHQTPLSAAMPGSVIHANAMAAFAQKLVVKEVSDWRLEASLILLAATVGSIFHVCLDGAIHGPLRWRPFVWLGMLVSAVVSVILVLGYALVPAETELVNSNGMVGTLTPALAVAFEGLAEMAMSIKQTAYDAIVEWSPWGAKKSKSHLALALAVGLAASSVPAWADDQGASGRTPCAPAPRSQARIVRLDAEPGTVSNAWVSRGTDHFAAQADCLLQIGDILQADPHTQVTLMLPDQTVKTVRAPDTFIVIGLAAVPTFDRIVALLKYLGDPNLTEAQAAARVHPGLSRGGDHPGPSLVPPVPQVPQRVGFDRPLLLRWEGAGPFAVSVRDKAGHEAAVSTAETTAELPLRGFVAGAGSLRIQGADGVSSVALEFVPDAAVPVIPGQSDVPEAARGTWLLLRANAAWKLEAMSRLAALARQGDPVAGAILGGMP